LSTEAEPWLKNWPVGVPKHIDYPQISLQGLLEQSAKDYPQKVAVALSGTEITYSQLDAICNQFANVLLAIDVKKSDSVAIQLLNILQFPIAFFGALKAGAVVTAISPLFREREVEHQLKDSGAQTMVTLDSLYPIVEKVRAKTKLNHVLVTEMDECGFPELLTGVSIEKPKVKIDPAQDLAALQYTGGTTGTAKGAMLTHRNLLSNALFRSQSELIIHFV
jgi:long-chain acyl-CoA synthetase